MQACSSSSLRHSCTYDLGIDSLGPQCKRCAADWDLQCTASDTLEALAHTTMQAPPQALIALCQLRFSVAGTRCCNSTWSLAWLAPILAMPGGPHKCPPACSAECTFQVAHDSKCASSTCVQLYRVQACQACQEGRGQKRRSFGFCPMERSRAWGTPRAAGGPGLPLSLIKQAKDKAGFAAYSCRPLRHAL